MHNLVNALMPLDCAFKKGYHGTLCVSYSQGWKLGWGGGCRGEVRLAQGCPWGGKAGQGVWLWKGQQPAWGTEGGQ